MDKVPYICIAGVGEVAAIGLGGVAIRWCRLWACLERDESFHMLLADASWCYLCSSDHVRNMENANGCGTIRLWAVVTFGGAVGVEVAGFLIRSISEAILHPFAYGSNMTMLSPWAV